MKKKLKQVAVDIILFLAPTILLMHLADKFMGVSEIETGIIIMAFIIYNAFCEGFKGQLGLR